MRKVLAITTIVVGVIMAIAGEYLGGDLLDPGGPEDHRLRRRQLCRRRPRERPDPAYCQADIIDHHTRDITGGLTYAELAQDDPNRAVAMDSAFLQASLFTSVVAFGVAGMAFVLGIVLTLIGLRCTVPAAATTRSPRGTGHGRRTWLRG